VARLAVESRCHRIGATLASARFNHRATPAYLTRVAQARRVFERRRRPDQTDAERLLELREVYHDLGCKEERDACRAEIIQLTTILAGPHKSLPVGTVYLVEAVGSGTAKIGFTTLDMKARLKKLVNGCPFQLKVRGLMPGTVADERRLHRQFGQQRVRNEWFTLDDRLLAAFPVVEWVHSSRRGRVPKRER
jgi:hypothetical protein